MVCHVLWVLSPRRVRVAVLQLVLRGREPALRPIRFSSQNWPASHHGAPEVRERGQDSLGVGKEDEKEGDMGEGTGGKRTDGGRG